MYFGDNVGKYDFANDFTDNISNRLIDIIMNDLFMQ